MGAASAAAAAPGVTTDPAFPQDAPLPDDTEMIGGGQGVLSGGTAPGSGAAIADVGTATTNGLTLQEIQQGYKMINGVKTLVQAGAGTAAGGAVAAGTGTSGGATGGTVTSGTGAGSGTTGLFNPDGSLNLAALATGAGGIYDYLNGANAYGLAKTLGDNATTLLNKPYTPFSASTFQNDPNWQSYISALTAPALQDIDIQSAQAKSAAQAKAAMSGQDITAYGALAGQPDIQQNLLDAAALYARSSTIANATAPAFTNAMNQYGLTYTEPLAAQQVGVNTLKAIQPFGSQSLGSLIQGAVGVAGTGTGTGTGTSTNSLQTLINQILGTGSSAPTTGADATQNIPIGDPSLTPANPATGTATAQQANDFFTGDPALATGGQTPDPATINGGNIGTGLDYTGDGP